MPQGNKVNITVHFVDPIHIVRQAEYRGHPQPQFVEGIFDPTSNTIWCPAGEDMHSLAICGHELRHAIMGPWHEEYWSPLAISKH